MVPKIVLVGCRGKVEGRGRNVDVMVDVFAVGAWLRCSPQHVNHVFVFTRLPDPDPVSHTHTACISSFQDP